ncbi:MAG: EcsC family protein [Deltaproteobacteria bacterium]|nr:EcsC family protein [Deltaproteobacteria bacterium]
MSNKRDALLVRAIDFAYDRVIGTEGGRNSATDLAAEHSRADRSLEENIDALVRWQVAKCAATGFVTGLGGLATLPITLPADLFANYYIQVRMVAAIAIMCGHDIRSDKARTLVYLSLCGNAAADVAKDLGARAGRHAVEATAARLSGRGAASVFSKLLPLVGGVVSGAIDAVACRVVGEAAKKIFGVGTKSAPS